MSTPSKNATLKTTVGFEYQPGRGGRAGGGGGYLMRAREVANAKVDNPGTQVLGIVGWNRYVCGGLRLMNRHGHRDDWVGDAKT